MRRVWLGSGERAEGTARTGRAGFWSRRARALHGGVGRAVVVFALSGMVALVVTGFGMVLAFRSTGKSEAVKEARLTTDLMANGIVQPALSDELLAGDQQAVAAFDRLVRDRVLSGRIIRVKLWRGDGVIAYSDEPRLIGQKFALAEDEQEILRDGGSAASVSDLSAPENIYEQPDKALLEVYEQVRTPSGQAALMEAYLPYDSVAASAESTWRSFLPALVVGLVALELLQFPLAWRLATQIARSNGERLRLLERAADAAEIERKHIAADLHDTVVQDLAAQRFGLLATAASLPEGSSPESAGALKAAADQVGGAVRRLREVLTELHPASLRPGELAQALGDLAAECEAPGLDVALTIGRLPKLTSAQEVAVFRVARESLRNVRKHADAKHVRVSLAAEHGMLVLRVGDDGAGFDPQPASQGTERGHLGMELLRSAAREADGTISISAAPGAGTTVTLEVPL